MSESTSTPTRQRSIARRASGWMLTALPLIVFLVVWQLYGGASRQRTFYFGTPTLVVETFVRDVADGSLLRHAGITGFEALAGFVLGNLVGAVVGLSLWYSESVARISRPYLAALGAVPVFAIAPMTIIWFGIGIGAKVILAFLATVFVAAAQAYKGAEQVDVLHLQRLRVFGASRWQIFRFLLVPSSLVWVISSLRLTIGLALLGAFIGEFIAADQGLGYMIVKAGGLYNVPRVLVGVISIVGIAMGVEKLVDVVERRTMKWRPRAEAEPAPRAAM